MTKQILFLDDDNNLRDSISSYLRSEGFAIDAVDSVQAALAVVNLKTPDLIISDIMMPHLDGYDFIQILRMNYLFVHIPVIFLTAKGMTYDRIKGYEMGCNAYLIKPFSPQELVAIMNNLLSNIEFWQSKEVFHKKLNSINDNYLQSLTPREKTVLNLVIKGLMNKEIAIQLNLSIRNVEKYVSRLLSKTNTRNRTELSQFICNMKKEATYIKGE